MMTTASIAQLREGVREGIVEENTHLMLTGQPKPFADRGLAATLEGTLDGAPAKAYAIGLLPEFETGAVVIAAVAPPGAEVARF